MMHDPCGEFHIHAIRKDIHHPDFDSRVAINPFQKLTDSGEIPGIQEFLKSLERKFCGNDRNVCAIVPVQESFLEHINHFISKVLEFRNLKFLL